MKQMRRITVIILAVLCIAMLISLTSCGEDMKIGNNTELGERFLNSLINDDYDTAYSLMENSVTEADFGSYWTTVQTITEGAKSYELEQIGWNINTKNSVTSNTTAYNVYFDNGKTMLFRVVTVNGVDGIAGVYCSDVTDFMTKTDAYVPVVNVVLAVVSVLAIAFSIWMLVDCCRRKIKYKVLWIILIFVGFSITLTVGETGGFNFMFGLMLKFSTIAADPSILSVKITAAIPVGAILYLCLRKKLIINPSPVNETENEEAFTFQNGTQEQIASLKNDAQAPNEESQE